MVQKFFKAFGTVNSITVFDGAGKAVNQAADTMRDASARWSVFEQKSEISQINRLAGKDFIRLKEDTFDLLKQSVKCSVVTGGAFDITIQPILEQYYGARNKGFRRLISLARRVNYKDILFDNASGAAMLRHKGQKLSLGAIAKGYAADMCIAHLKNLGVSSALVNLGGTVAVLGEERQAGIRNPLNKDGIMCTLRIKDAVLSTSGGYERAIASGGKAACHIFDTRTCKPAHTDLLSVSILSQNGALADALSTAVFALGAQRGGKLCEKLGAQAVFANANLNIYATDNLKDVLSVYPAAG